MAPGSPSRGVRPIVVSMDFPSWIAAAEAPDPRCSEINDVSSAGYHIKEWKCLSAHQSTRGEQRKDNSGYFLKELCGLPEDERIADPVEPIFPYLLLLRHLGVERIRVDMGRYAPRMERRVEVGNVDGPG